MTVQELINELQVINEPDAQVGWEMGSRDLTLLIGEDSDTGSSIIIIRPSWNG